MDDSLTFRVSGMTCSGCARTVQRAAQAVPGVLSATVDLPTATLKARVDPSRADARALEAAIRQAGYGAQSEAA